MLTTHRYCSVPQPLSSYVRTILILDARGVEAEVDLPLVTNGMSAFFYREDGLEQKAMLFGQSVPDDEWILNERSIIIAVFFKPFALAAMFKRSAKELKDNLSLPIWNQKSAVALSTRLIKVNSIEAKIGLLCNFLNVQLEANKVNCEIIRYATDRMMEDPEPNIMTQLLQKLNLTERTFQRIFKKYVGITPSEYRRICQFQQAFFQLKTGTFENLTDVAYSNGYFDQSHYTRSFKEFTDTTPNDYLQSGLSKK